MELAKAYVQVLPSTKGLKSNLTNEFNDAGNASGSSFGGSFVGTIKKIIVAAGIGTIVKEALDAGGAIQQSFGGLDTLYEDASDAAKKYAKEAAKAGISMNDYAEQAVSFGASLKQAFEGDTAKAVEAANTAILDMADNAAKMGTPLENIQNAYQGFTKQNYTMLDNLKLGYGGTKSEMERLLARAQEISGVEYKLDNLGDVYEAIHVIQGELGLTGVAADEAKTTLTGSMGAMKAAFTNFLADLTTGQDISEDMNTLFESAFNFVRGNLAPMVGNLLSALPDIISVGLSEIIRTINIISNNADVFVQNGVELVSELLVGIIEAIPYLVEAIINLGVSFGEALMSLDWPGIASEFMESLSSSMDLAAGEIFGSDENLLNAIVDWITRTLPVLWEKGSEMISNVAVGIFENMPYLLDAANQVLESALGLITDLLPSFLESGINMVMNIANGLLANLPAIIESIGNILETLIQFIVDNLPTILEAGKNMLLSLVKGIVNNLPQIVSSAAQVIAKLVATIAKNLPTILKSGISIIAELAVGLIKAIPDLVKKIPEIIESIKTAFGEYDWKELGKNVLTGIKDGITGAVSSVVSAAKSAASDIFDAVKDFFKIGSPSKLMRDEIGQWIPKGLAVGISANMQPVNDAMDELNQSMIGPVGDIQGSLSAEYELNNNANDQKYDEIIKMMKELKQNLGKQKIVLNTGVLVGETVEQMDEALGILANKNRRGVYA